LLDYPFKYLMKKFKIEIKEAPGRFEKDKRSTASQNKD
jgi:hypothetical protein